MHFILMLVFAYGISSALIFHFSNTIGQRIKIFNALDNELIYCFFIIAPISAICLSVMWVLHIIRSPFRSKKEKKAEKTREERKLISEQQALSEELDKLIFEEEMK